LASVGQLPIGCTAVSNAHFQKSIAISREISNEFQEAVGHQKFALSLNFQGRIYCVDNQSEGKAITAENELAKSTLFWKKEWEKGKKYHGLSLDYAEKRGQSRIYFVGANNYSPLPSPISRISMIFAILGQPPGKSITTTSWKIYYRIVNAFAAAKFPGFLLFSRDGVIF
jgi:hypothetical protein